MARLGISATGLAAGIALAVLAVVWSWWAVKEGGYFGAVMYPGLVVLCAGFVLCSSRAAWPTSLRLGRAGRVCLAALLALAAWSALSALWSPAPDVAVADAQRIAGYGLAFALGAWLVTLLGEWRFLALAPLTLAGLFAGIVTVAELLASTDIRSLLDEGTLQYPLGYRNANAAFFAVAAFPAVGLASSRQLHWLLRGAALGTATLAIELAMLSQSRGSMIGAALALAVYFIASRERARDLGWLALAALPALVILPALTDLYQAADVESYRPVDELRTAGEAVIGGAALATLAGALAASLGGRVRPSATLRRNADRAAIAVVVAAITAGLVAFVVATGNPFTWLGDRVDEFVTQGSPGTEGTSRFGVNAGTERDDLWRVALEIAGDEPVAGSGAGGYEYEYPVRRAEDGVESVRDAHSVELEILSELGVIGLTLFVVAVVAAFAGALAGAFRRREPPARSAALIGCSLAAAAYWLGHASLDWFWTYAVVTAPVFALLGSACAAAGADADADAPPGRWRVAGWAAAGLLAVSVVPPYLSERYVDAGYAGWRTDPERAADDLDRARDLNQLSIEPLLAAAAIARERGDEDEAIAGFEEVARERPEEWAAHYFLADLFRERDPARARAELQAAEELNPYSFELSELREKITGEPPAD